jgi:hypothetical protein
LLALGGTAEAVPYPTPIYEIVSKNHAAKNTASKYNSTADSVAAPE